MNVDRSFIYKRKSMVTDLFWQRNRDYVGSLSHVRCLTKQINSGDSYNFLIWLNIILCDVEVNSRSSISRLQCRPNDIKYVLNMKYD